MFRYLPFTKIKKPTVVLLNNSRATDFSVVVKAKAEGKKSCYMRFRMELHSDQI